MASEATDIGAAGYGNVTERGPGRSRYFLVMSGVLLLILLAGFAPSLYLRAVLDVPDMPIYLHVHGVILTCWFLFLVLQASLVAGGRTDIHRKTGVAAALLAVVIVFAGPMATIGFVGRLRGLGVDIDALIYELTWIIGANILGILAFAIFVAAGIILRQRPDTHKRLMLLATISIIGPPLARISRWPVFGETTETEFVVAGSLILLATLGAYDYVVKKRLPTVTLVGGFFCALTILVPPVIAFTDIAQEFTRSLG